MYDQPSYLLAGDQAVVVELGDTIDPETNLMVHRLSRALEREAVAGIVELVPTYRSILVHFDASVTSAAEVVEHMRAAADSLDEEVLDEPLTVEVPVLYGGEYGLDLDYVAEHTGLTADDVVAHHTGTEYLVYGMGFSPGFPYLGGLPERLITPRLETPRVLIPGGSVGIAEAQTGVYPVASPGGWRLIGRTPLRFFDPDREPPSLLKAGDHVRFVPLDSEEEYAEIQRQVDAGAFPASPEATQ